MHVSAWLRPFLGPSLERFGRAGGLEVGAKAVPEATPHSHRGRFGIGVGATVANKPRAILGRLTQPDVGDVMPLSHVGMAGRLRVAQARGLLHMQIELP